MNRATGYPRILFLPFLLAGLLGSSPAYAATRGSHASSSGTRSTSSSHVARARTSTRTSGTHVKAHASAPSRPRSVSPRATTRAGVTTARTHATKAAPVARASTAPRSSRASHSAVVGRTTTGRIVRSENAKRRFERQSGFPKGRPGYVVDHVKPLACGGADVPSNMQWQTIAAAKAKDKTERAGCR